MFVKIAGAALVMLCGILFNFKVKYEAKERIAELEEFLKITDSVKNDIFFKKLTVLKCLKNLEIENSLVEDYICKIAGFLEMGNTIPVSVQKAVKISNLYLKDEDLKIVNGFFENLGQTAYENQLENAVYTMEKLTRRTGEIKKMREKNEKTQCSLVLGCAAAIVIVLC